MALVGAKRDLRDENDDHTVDRQEMETEMREHYMGKYEVLFFHKESCFLVFQPI